MHRDYPCASYGVRLFRGLYASGTVGSRFIKSRIRSYLRRKRRRFMTKDKQQIAIAEACGWKPLIIQHERDSYSFYESTPPDYLNDLNAMHEAWKTLTYEQHKQSRQHSQMIVYRDGFTSDNPHRSVSNAASTQRAEAFLRTIGKWVEE